MQLKFSFYSVAATVLICCGSCDKLVEVPEPVDTITSNETFSTDANATSNILGIYSDMVTSGNKGAPAFCSGIITTMAALSADELTVGIPDDNRLQFQNNTLQASNGAIYEYFWRSAYTDIYYTNAAIEGLQSSASVSRTTKDQLTGEATFLRAFLYFNLVNLFGDVPLATTTEWAKTALMARTPSSQIYQQIIADLKEAESLLPSDYEKSGGERIRAIKWAATALLARTYLYTGEWEKAEGQATLIVNNIAQYHLVGELNNTFLANSSEAIWQLQVSNQSAPYATYEGNDIIPYDSNTNYHLTPQLLSAFEPGDKRYIAWIDSVRYEGVYYYFPYKYKVRQGEPNGAVPEYYTMLRLGEQFLIRAEARAKLHNLTGAIADINMIRNRAGLSDLPSTLDEVQVLKAVAKERRIELLVEWGHRWADLKRTGQADAVLKPIKPQWQATQKLYPIPLSELSTDPNLIQNPGY